MTYKANKKGALVMGATEMNAYTSFSSCNISSSSSLPLLLLSTSPGLPSSSKKVLKPVTSLNLLLLSPPSDRLDVDAGAILMPWVEFLSLVS
eukprot:CAMPEP_0170859364 /NCGR_PEP_ID=MMETSP0734-20130129/16687_1 /TAXON_ID=186038 /ORGANISM="Fragilariopsis kerguelensis, Strain L26-C5" /LENGTH=91 /DNA_ID=CAMNT_0011232465 /DNA_START=800 /DNA_END=1075 /DNA_ORIENTATION=+